MGRSAKIRHRRQRRERRWVEVWLRWADAAYGNDDGSMGLRHVCDGGGWCLLVSTLPPEPKSWRP